ncbi:MAG TPA: hypothetical protein VH599_21835 [Ktedonobacterales bacterium]|jgi:hypothetical protein
MQKWEYLFVTVAGEIRSDKGQQVFSVNGQEVWGQRWLAYAYANHLGDQGWELVSTISSTPVWSQLVFKRPKA